MGEKKENNERNYWTFVSSVWIKASAPFSFQSCSEKGKQSVLIKDWINPQSDSFSIKKLFIGTAKLDVPYEKGEGRERRSGGF